jgi:hypothetical protein
MTADFIRGIMVSAAALIIGFSTMSTFLLIKGRQLGRTYTIPGWVNFLFLIGYNLLLISVVFNRWTSVGTPLTVSTAIASIGIALNVISVVCYSWYIKESD